MTTPAVASAPERPKPGRPPMSPRHRNRLRLDISRAAIRLFRVHGVAGTSGERIAEEVGLSARTLWRHFRVKEECVEPVLTRSLDVFVETLRRWPPSWAAGGRPTHRPPRRGSRGGDPRRRRRERHGG